MKKRDLKDWIIAMTIIPTMLTGIILATYFTTSRFHQLDTNLIHNGTNIIETLSIASELALIEKNKRQLKRLIYSTHRKNSEQITNIAVYNLNRELLLFSGNQKDLALLAITDQQAVATHTTFKHLDEQVIIYSPIYASLNSATIGAINNEQLIGYIVMQLNKHRLLLDQKTTMLFSLITILIGLIIAIYFAVKLVNKIIYPVRRMVDAINLISNGNTEVYINEQLTGELNLLKNGINVIAKSFNAVNLEMQMNIEQATCDLRETMEQVEIQNVELNLAKRKALDANRVKSEFLANMSHELRTPLNGVIGFTRQLLKTPLNNNQKDYLETIASSANSLLTIIDDILDFSKLDAGRMVFENIPFPLRDTINEVVTLLASGADDKQLEFSLRISPELPDDLIADPTRIKQVLLNIIGNAIKFTEKGSVIVELSLLERKLDDIYIQCAVKDTGIGIQAEQQNNLFAAFGQADSSITRRYGGTGLGLIISQKLAEQMQGKITFDSQVNQGSTFSFSFYCKLHNAPLSPALPIAPLKGQSIIYFERDPHTRMAISELLTSWGMNVTQFGDFAILKRLIRSGKNYDMAILSQRVSNKMLHQIKELVNDIRPIVERIFLLINTISPDTRELILNCGITACFSRPVNHRKLANALAKVEVVDNQLTNHPPFAQQKLTINILAVDDNEANLKLISTLLLELVEQVEVTRNGAEALALCTIKSFDIIFMDIQMPVMDGITACQQIQSASLNRNTPIYAVTAHALAGEKERLMEVGFAGYLTKPIDEQTLIQTIENSGIHKKHDSSLINVANSTQPIFNHQAEKHRQEIEIDQQPTLSASLNLPTSPGIDWELAKQNAGGRIELAIDMFKMLLDSLPASKQSIETALEDHNISDILKNVHKLHGACCYVGVPRMKNLANFIETQIKKQVTIEQVMPEVYELLDEIDNLIEDCQSWNAAQPIISPS